MKIYRIGGPSCRRQFALATMLFIVTAVSFADDCAADIISLNGSLYTNISASSQHSAPYEPSNLFDEIAPIVDQEIDPTDGSDANDAYAGLGFGPHYVAFELDMAYDINEIYYAQRAFMGSDTSDKVASIDLWVSTTGSFSATDPGTASDAQIVVSQNVEDVFLQYSAGSTLNGQYFLLRLNGGSGSHPGGAEFRLGFSAVPEPSGVFLIGVFSLCIVLCKRKN